MLINPETLGKLLRVMGVKVGFPEDRRVMVVRQGDKENEVTLDDLQKAINGE